MLCGGLQRQMEYRCGKEVRDQSVSAQTWLSVVAFRRGTHSDMAYSRGFNTDVVLNLPTLPHRFLCDLDVAFTQVVFAFGASKQTCWALHLQWHNGTW